MPITDGGRWFPDDSELVSPIEAILERMQESNDLPESSDNLPWRSLVRTAVVDSVPNNTATQLSGGWVGGTGDPGVSASGINFVSGALVPSRAGLYYIEASIMFGTVALTSGLRQVQLRLNGSIIPGAIRSYAPPSATASATVPLAAGDQITVWAFQNSGASIELPVTSIAPAWSMTRLRLT